MKIIQEESKVRRRSSIRTDRFNLWKTKFAMVRKSHNLHVLEGLDASILFHHKGLSPHTRFIFGLCLSSKPIEGNKFSCIR
jgi:hypothetical protein